MPSYKSTHINNFKAKEKWQRTCSTFLFCFYKLAFIISKYTENHRSTSLNILVIYFHLFRTFVMWFNFLYVGPGEIYSSNITIIAREMFYISRAINNITLVLKYLYKSLFSRYSICLDFLLIFWSWDNLEVSKLGLNKLLLSKSARSLTTSSLTIRKHI